jgi:hypothetical protein
MTNDSNNLIKCISNKGIMIILLIAIISYHSQPVEASKADKELIAEYLKTKMKNKFYLRIGVSTIKLLIGQKDVTNVFPGPEVSYRAYNGELISPNPEDFSESFHSMFERIGTGAPELREYDRGSLVTLTKFKLKKDEIEIELKVGGGEKNKIRFTFKEEMAAYTLDTVNELFDFTFAAEKSDLGETKSSDFSFSAEEADVLDTVKLTRKDLENIVGTRRTLKIDVLDALIRVSEEHLTREQMTHVYRNDKIEYKGGFIFNAAHRAQSTAVEMIDEIQSSSYGELGKEFVLLERGTTVDVTRVKVNKKSFDIYVMGQPNSNFSSVSREGHRHQDIRIKFEAKKKLNDAYITELFHTGFAKLDEHVATKYNAPNERIQTEIAWFMTFLNEKLWTLKAVGPYKQHEIVEANNRLMVSDAQNTLYQAVYKRIKEIERDYDECSVSADFPSPHDDGWELKLINPQSSSIYPHKVSRRRFNKCGLAPGIANPVLGHSVIGSEATDDLLGLDYYVLDRGHVAQDPKSLTETRQRFKFVKASRIWNTAKEMQRYDGYHVNFNSHSGKPNDGFYVEKQFDEIVLNYLKDLRREVEEIRAVANSKVLAFQDNLEQERRKAEASLEQERRKAEARRVAANKAEAQKRYLTLGRDYWDKETKYTHPKTSHPMFVSLASVVTDSIENTVAVFRKAKLGKNIDLLIKQGFFGFRLITDFNKLRTDLVFADRDTLTFNRHLRKFNDWIATSESLGVSPDFKEIGRMALTPQYSSIDGSKEIHQCGTPIGRVQVHLDFNFVGKPKPHLQLSIDAGDRPSGERRMDTSKVPITASRIARAVANDDREWLNRAEEATQEGKDYVSEIRWVTTPSPKLSCWEAFQEVTWSKSGVDSELLSEVFSPKGLAEARSVMSTHFAPFKEWFDRDQSRKEVERQEAEAKRQEELKKKRLIEESFN